MHHSVYFLCLCMLFFACQSTKSNSSQDQVDEIVKKEIGEHTSSDSNETESHTIYRKEKDLNTNLPQIEYVVIKNNPASVVKKGFISMGSIDWVDNNSFKILDLPRVMPEDKTMEDFVYIINLDKP